MLTRDTAPAESPRSGSSRECEKVDVTGEARGTVKGHGMTADNQIVNFVRVQ